MHPPLRTRTCRVVSPRGLVSFEKMKGLTSVQIIGAGRIVAEASALRGLTHLKSLNLNKSAAEDEDLQCLSALHGLSEISLAGCRCSFLTSWCEICCLCTAGCLFRQFDAVLQKERTGQHQPGGTQARAIRGAGVDDLLAAMLEPRHACSCLCGLLLAGRMMSS